MNLIVSLWLANQTLINFSTDLIIHCIFYMEIFHFNLDAFYRNSNPNFSNSLIKFLETWIRVSLSEDRY